MARKPSARRTAPPPMMLTVRRLHLYIGLFIAPSVLFFAFTGALQLFSLHESHGAYEPPALIEKLGSLHKDQRFGVKAKRPGPAGAAAAHDDHDHADADHDHDHADADHDHDHDAMAAPQGGEKAHAGVAKADPKALSSKPFKEAALKWLFLAVAVGLFLSTALGVWMGLAFARSKPLAWVLLLAGAVLPVLLVAL